MLVRELITRAYYLSNVVGREYETVNGSQITDGLNLLNEMLASFSASQYIIPYDSHTVVASTPGISSFTVNNLVSCEDVTFKIDTTIYRMYQMTKRQYYGDFRVEVDSLPYAYYPERVVSGTKINLYYMPTDSVDSFTVTGKYALNDVALADELNSTVGSVYQPFLIYSLAEWIGNFYQMPIKPNVQAKLKELTRQIKEMVPPDFSYKIQTTLSKQPGFNYAIQNFGGWTAP